jgi:filamin
MPMLGEKNVNVLIRVGSPFMVSVGGQPSGRIRETKVIQVQNAELVTPGQACQIQLKIPGL